MTDNSQVLKIEGDLDKEKGNIESKVSVVVMGSVKSGCSIKTDGDITVMGIVEDAELEAGGSIDIRERFRGKGHGRAVAVKDVILNYSDSQTVLAGNDVIVKDGLVHSHVEANNKIVVSGNKGIIGGKASAGKMIDVKTAGASTNTQTLLCTGIDVENRRKLENLEHDIHINVENTNKIVKSHHLINKIKVLRGELSSEQEAILQKLVSTFEKLKEERELINGKIGELIKNHMNVDSQIKIEKKVYPGVKLEFGIIKMNVRDEASKVLFQIKDGTIKAMRF
ncbi:FapA family protein [candidate division KSB1 bacterium]